MEFASCATPQAVPDVFLETAIEGGFRFVANLCRYLGNADAEEGAQ
jgi:hypothetical protein